MSSSTTSLKKPANSFVRVMRRVYNPLGFSKGYNAILGELLNTIFPEAQH
jgi:hypothetical protein